MQIPQSSFIRFCFSERGGTKKGFILPKCPVRCASLVLPTSPNSEWSRE